MPNLTRGLIPTGLDQIWVADITYVRLARGVRLSGRRLDAYSRKVVGWALDDHLEAQLAIEALDMAIAAREPAARRPDPPFRPRRAIRLRRLRRAPGGVADRQPA